MMEKTQMMEAKRDQILLQMNASLAVHMKELVEKKTLNERRGKCNAFSPV